MITQEEKIRRYFSPTILKFTTTFKSRVPYVILQSLANMLQGLIHLFIKCWEALTHFMPLSSFYTSRKHQKTRERFSNIFIFIGYRKKLVAWHFTISRVTYVTVCLSPFLRKFESWLTTRNEEKLTPVFPWEISGKFHSRSFVNRCVVRILQRSMKKLFFKSS